MYNLIYITLIVFIIGYAYPQETIYIAGKIRRYLHEQYAKRNGQETADKYLPLDPWE